MAARDHGLARNSAAETLARQRRPDLTPGFARALALLDDRHIQPKALERSGVAANGQYQTLPDRPDLVEQSGHSVADEERGGVEQRRRAALIP
jgi:hypothetical protein